MGEQDREGLKRGSDDLLDLSSDDNCSAKRPRCEASVRELDKQTERRQKNKEAAEKSRKKKKEEFSKLQSENDQLQQDKCQLVAAIETLKGDLGKVSKENSGLRSNIDHLKRWIGKHAKDLGLGRHVQRRPAEDAGLPKPGKVQHERVLRGDPSLRSVSPPSPGSEPVQVARPASTSPPPSSVSLGSASSVGTVSPSTSPGPMLAGSALASLYPQVAASPPHISHDCFQPVGIRTVVTLPQLPLPQQPPVPFQYSSAGQQPPVTFQYSSAGQQPPVTFQYSSAAQQQPEVLYPGAQPLVYFSKDPVFVVQGVEDRQVLMMAPKVQPDLRLQAPELQHVTMAAQAAPQMSEVFPGASRAGMVRPEAELGHQEGSGRQEACVETPQERHADVTEVQLLAVEAPQAPPSSGRALQVPAASEESSSSRKEALPGDTASTAPPAAEPTEAVHTDTAGLNTTAADQQMQKSIQLLMQMGYKIVMPDDVLKGQPKGATLTVDR